MKRWGAPDTSPSPARCILSDNSCPRLLNAVLYRALRNTSSAAPQKFVEGC
jgi:hypothetical protein